MFHFDATQVQHTFSPEARTSLKRLGPERQFLNSGSSLPAVRTLSWSAYVPGLPCFAVAVLDQCSWRDPKVSKTEQMQAPAASRPHRPVPRSSPRAITFIFRDYSLFHIAMAGPVSIIFGATGGIGAATARLLHKRGHQLVLVARNKEKLDQLAGELGGSRPSDTGAPTVHAADILQSAAVEEAFKKALDQHGTLDHVTHCVGSIVLKPITSVSDELLQETLQLNTASAFYVLRAACKQLPRLRQSTGDGPVNKSVTLCTSAVSMHGLPNHEAIAAAKAGVIGMARSAAASFAPRGLRVNCVAPGMTETPLASFITERPASRKASEVLHPLGRIGRPEEVASAIVLLIENPFITGQVLAVDGGLSTLVSQQSAR